MKLIKRVTKKLARNLFIVSFIIRYICLYCNQLGAIGTGYSYGTSKMSEINKEKIMSDIDMHFPKLERVNQKVLTILLVI